MRSKFNFFAKPTMPATGTQLQQQTSTTIILLHLQFIWFLYLKSQCPQNTNRFLTLVYGYHPFLVRLDLWQRCFYCKNAILGQRWLDEFRIRARRQHKFSVVLPIHGLVWCLFLVLGTDLENEIKQYLKMSHSIKNILVKCDITGIQGIPYNKYII